MNSSEDDISDVLIIGGGPAGSTAAAFLSQMGWRVTLLEQDRHPRFHIGESLLPANVDIFERLGVMPELEKIGTVKRGVDFTLTADGAYQFFDFSRAKALKHKSAFQVHRAELDHILIDNAAAKGVRVVQGVRVVDATIDTTEPVRVRSRDETGAETEWRARFLIDASGRGTFLASKLNLKSRNRRHNSAAIFTHFTGAERRPGEHAGNISVYWHKHGWFWFIPLNSGVTSVGIVSHPDHLKSRTSSTDQFLQDSIAACPPLAQRLANAAPKMPAKATGNFSYYSEKMYGDNFLMIGDAYGFIDPVFSSGVLLAMFGGDLGAKTVDACLRRPALKGFYLRRHAFIVRRGMRRISWFIYSFTNPALKTMFMDPKNVFKIQDSVISLLAGDLFYRFRLSVPLLLFKGIFHYIRLLPRGG